ncbi:ORF6N domain-containing protein [Rugamonas sp. DEMB1]|jgi:hypothetical protein|uniref:ORF6N domain-containing protein n=1 Tax=Rugamonas sp. DEMB1 TaxID=3039386 RepID=UPI002449D419|nr:ORF6N domain-containing protein [Rugamonas sp. DEMB1]WGG51889.1 ORF6N domain-containing protein [Rugamonas sp. DEMB1]
MKPTLPTFEQRILAIRGQRVMLDSDLAMLYGVATKVLLQAIRRNHDRFPGDFMFQLDASEWEALRSQSVTSNSGRGGRRYSPYAFTEHGVAMLSSVLGSAQAIAVNIEIIRAFVRLRELVASNKEFTQRLTALEGKTNNLCLKHNTLANETQVQIRHILDAIRGLMVPPEQTKKRPIGFITPSDEPAKPK